MSLLTGTVIAIEEKDGVRIARVNIRGARIHVPVDLLPDAKIGETILIESGVAIARVQNGEEKEQKPDVPGNPG